MIEVISGLPGHGKTLFALASVAVRAKQEKRQVFFHGIESLKFPDWMPCNPEKWFELPDGAIVVIDEAQTVFPLRPVGAHVPEKVSRLETHRHNGFDLYLVTQDAKLVDAHVRKLVGSHRNIHRPWGVRTASVSHWERIADPRDWADQKMASVSPFVYPRALFNQYHSATQHTVRFKVPARVWWVGLILLVTLSVFGVIAYKIYQGKFLGQGKKQVEQGIVSATISQPVKYPGEVKVTAADLVRGLAPRIVGLPYTAPLYDDLRKAVRMPKAVACLFTAQRCQCYTQDASRISDMPDELCRALTVNGFFDPYEQPLRIQPAGLPYQRPPETSKEVSESYVRPGARQVPVKVDLPPSGLVPFTSSSQDAASVQQGAAQQRRY